LPRELRSFAFVRVGELRAIILSRASRWRLAYAQRSGAVVAIVVEVEIDRCTGKVWARTLACGLFADFPVCVLIGGPEGDEI
jgi:hypothetical protein